MSWANAHIAKLIAGETVKFRPHGGSMKGRVESGQLVTVEPVGDRELRKGDVVLCKVHGSQYLHLIKAVSQKGGFLIGNNKGGTNGWCSRASIYGICTKVEP